MLSERELIAQIRSQVEVNHPSVARSIGDDCAVFTPEAGKQCLVTTDALVETVHFDRAWHPPLLLGRKAAAVNLSDIAAMGGEPRYALLSIAAPPSTEKSWVEQVLTGFLAALTEHDTLLIGGDTVSSGQLVFSVTLIGQADPDKILYRSRALPGDQVWVSGPLGQAAAGLDLCRQPEREPRKQWAQLVEAHLNPRPRVRLGRLLADTGELHAMMDLSDGLATDLAHLCSESKVGAEIWAEYLPISPALLEAAAFLDRTAVDYALRGGEDYELLFTASPAAGGKLSKLVREATGQEIYCVGRIEAGSGVRLLQAGERREIAYQGYEHFHS